MELRHLRYFLAAADELHFGRAADVLCVTRPAVSQTISDLEAELGVKLFFRHAQKVTLTAAGAALQRDIRIVLADISRAVEVARRIGKGKSGRINVGYGTLTLFHPLFRDVVKSFRSVHAEVDVSLHEMVSALQIPAVRAGRLDVAFVYVPDTERWPHGSLSDFDTIDDLAHLDIAFGGLAVAVPADHRLATRDSVALSDLADDGLILVQRSNVTPRQALLETMCQAQGFVPQIVQEVSNINTQMNLISVGMGVGLAVQTPFLRYPPTVKIVPLRDVDFPVRFCVIWRKGLVEPILSSFIDAVREAAARHRG